ncbi:MAG: hypothetical protein L6R36_001874 [Xanthoria steineri]|nr:MAG: hypothetical protein L6R36_001874 [Xanthoria steineri]
MGDMFPEIKKKTSDVMEILNEEEESFAKTLDRGERQFEDYAQKCKLKDSRQLHGALVWRLYDTFGFPVDLTRLMAEERGLSIDDTEFEEARLKAKEASRGEKKAASNLVKLDVHDINALSKLPDVTQTDDSAKFGRKNIDANIQAIYHDKQFHSSTNDFPADAQIGICLDCTNFYAEQGGQENDTGRLIIDGVAELEVSNVQVYAGYVLHTGYMKYGTLNTGDKITCEYEELRRWPIRNNHTGTHILNYALREVLGDGIDQRGSLVAAEKLRFDFSHKTAVSDAELEKIEDECTKYIRQNFPVYAKDVALETARQIQGVRAVFGETYPDPVRVVSVGVEVEELLRNPGNEEWRKVSVEFCGGTHVAKTGDIKELVILEESGIAKGIRRIIAVTGEDAYEVQRVADLFGERLTRLEKMGYGSEKEAELKTVQQESGRLSISAITKGKFRERLAKVVKGQVDEQKAVQKKEMKMATEAVMQFFEGNKEEKVFVGRLPGVGANAKAVGEALNSVKAKMGEKVVYLFALEGEEGKEEGGKVVHGCYVPEGASKQGASATDWANTVSQIVGGKAGGKGATCIGNGTDPKKVDEAVEAARKYLERFTFHPKPSTYLPLFHPPTPHPPPPKKTPIRIPQPPTKFSPPLFTHPHTQPFPNQSTYPTSSFPPSPMAVFLYVSMECYSAVRIKCTRACVAKGEEEEVCM